MMNRFFTLLFAASCLTAVGQSEYCLEGTVWDDELGGCVSVILNSADINNDGCVQLGDLLDLLTAYGDCGDEESAWQCGDPLEYQGYDYATVPIGEQCWFAENLRTESYSDATSIPQIDSSYYSWNDAVQGSWGICDDVLGGFYNYFAVVDSRGLCPSGWKVPSKQDFEVIFQQVDQAIAGAHLKSTDGWVNGLDTYGFNMLPSAVHIGHECDASSHQASYWTSTQYTGWPYNGMNAWRFYADEGNSFLSFNVPKTNAYNVRCLQVSDE